MRVSFIIPALNEDKYIEDCLRSVFTLSDLEEFEVIVVDNNSTDQTAWLVKQTYPQVNLILETKPGPASAKNAGAKIAKGEYLAFIDADCRLPKGWWNRARDMFSKYNNLVLLFGQYDYKSHGAVRFLEVASFWVVLFSEFIMRSILRIGGPVFGGNMVMRRMDFFNAGGFDERYDFYGEDIAFGKKAMKLGLVKMDRELSVVSSGRRFQQAGAITTGFIYSMNTFWVCLFGRVLFKKHKVVR